MSKQSPALHRKTQLKLLWDSHEDLVLLSTAERRELICAMGTLMCVSGLEEPCSAEKEETDG